MELLGPVVDIVLFFWNPVSRHIRYLKHLNNNVETLKKETQELRCKGDEIQAAVDDAMSVGKTRKPLVENWLVDARSIEAEVDSIILEFEQRRTCLNGCCTDHLSRYKLGKRVVKNMEEVKKRKDKGVFDEVAESPPRQRVLEMQPSLPRGQQSTSEKTMEEIWQCLHDEENGIVCVYGMGGIGKTTLMKAINNRFTKTNDFHIVIWVTVSNDLNLGLIQEQIGNRLVIQFHINEQKRNKLFARLKNVRYLLILDDLWEAFSLDQVGIPKPDKQNGCKIAITTRFVAVCNAMGADKQIRVRALTHVEAWNLFCERCGDVVVSSEIRPVAEKVVEECGGLPLAIKTVGRAMHRKDKKVLWEDALRALKGSSPEVPGMEREVFLPLKLSYDCLENDKIKLCFLYCSLFPEDADIEIDELVRYWVMEEGFIENVNNFEEASNKGHSILERIKDACLLEDGSQGDGYVRMHDLLRDLAIWITSPSSLSSSKGSKFLVKAGEGLMHPPEEKMGGGIGRISLMRNKIEHLQIMSDCPNLVTLFLNQNRQLHTICSDFFNLMPRLQILDLSDTSIKSLPNTLSLLVNLRALILKWCRRLAEVPPLGKLKELQLLDLTGTRLKNFPQGTAGLVKLKQLDLSHSDITAIPWNMIYRLPSLEYLNMLKMEHVDGAIFSGTATMKRLMSLSISMSNLNGFIAKDMFHQWCSGLRRFKVEVGCGMYAIPVYPIDKHIDFHECDNFPYGIEGLIKHSISVRFNSCNGLRSLSLLVGDSKSLRDLHANRCCGLECIIDWREVGDDALHCLQKLDLCFLPNLEKVFNGVAPLPKTSLQNLREIIIEECTKLRSLFSSCMVEQLHQLEKIRVRYCSKMEEIIEGDMLPHNSFPRLRFICLRELSELASIFSRNFIFLSLEEIKVTSCPRLKKLPLLYSSIHQIRGEIEGKREWWEGLEWEDENSKSLYSTIYKEDSSDEEEGNSSPPGLISKEHIRQLNRTQSNPECIRQLKRIESNAAATQQMRIALSAPFDNRVDAETASSSALF